MKFQSTLYHDNVCRFPEFTGVRVMMMPFEMTIRLSLPSDAPWFEGYTPNPTGVQPTGPILPRRTKQMGFRP